MCPWEAEMVDPINVLVDISHWNRDVDFAKLANAGIIGVIQKATQGQTGVDFTYNTNKPKALAAGLLWVSLRRRQRRSSSSRALLVNSK